MNKSTLTALAAGMGLMVSSTVGAESLGEVWMTDQQNGTLYVYDQAELNTDPANASPLIIDLQAATDKHKVKGVQSTIVNHKNHLIGFNNKKGTDKQSRAHLAYLGGDMQVWKTHGKKGEPQLVFSEHVTTSANSLHMCGSNTANTEIMCSSIGGKELITYSADYATDTYTKTGAFPLGGLTVNANAAPGTAATVASMGLGGSKPICNNYSTDNSLAFVTTTAGTSKGVLVLETAGMTIVNAVAGTGVGCGLVNSKEGDSMWTNAGSNSNADQETAMRWDYATVTTVGGPSATIVMPVVNGEHGDVHGAQFAGLGGNFLWELMRLDNVIHVIEPDSATLVNAIDLTSTTGIDNLGGDVLDRSALGTRMYMSTRGYAPITAITGFIDADRNPGVNVVGTIFGFGAVGVGHAEVRSGVLGDLCIEDGHGDHDHEDPECPEGSARLDNADPHGLKSLSYLSGGF